MEGYFSDWKSVTSAMPQGSVLGTMLLLFGITIWIILQTMITIRDQNTDWRNPSQDYFLMSEKQS